jgi:hypothetical protein
MNVINNTIKFGTNVEDTHDLIYCSTITAKKLHNKICKDRKEIKDTNQNGKRLKKRGEVTTWEDLHKSI